MEKDLGGITMIVKKKVKGIDEGKKDTTNKMELVHQNTQSLTTMVKRNIKMVVISLISKLSKTKKTKVCKHITQRWICLWI